MRTAILVALLAAGLAALACLAIYADTTGAGR
jgi:hypothetical protein